MTLVSIHALVDDLVRDKDQVIASPTRANAIDDAVRRYSVDAPRTIVVDVPGAGTTRVDLPTTWVEGESELQSIEYPVDQFPPAMLDSDAAQLYQTPSGLKLQLGFQPTIGEPLRLTHTAPHILDDTQDTIPPKFRRAVACLAASDLCGQLSAHYATEAETSISADAVDHIGKTERFRNRAKDLLAEYVRLVGVAPSPRTKPASVDANPTRTTALGFPRLFHPVRNWPAQ
ncbi:MAG: hypothetical protein IJI03_17170 [Rudaea sp.]|nr:hypothetical protein [Rudaea sp.]